MNTQPRLDPIPYAVTEDGETLTFNPSKDGHLLVVGARGSDKTTMMKEIVGLSDAPWDLSLGRTRCYIGGELGSGRGYWAAFSEAPIGSSHQVMEPGQALG